MKSWMDSNLCEGCSKVYGVPYTVYLRVKYNIKPVPRSRKNVSIFTELHPCRFSLFLIGQILLLIILFKTNVFKDRWSKSILDWTILDIFSRSTAYLLYYFLNCRINLRFSCVFVFFIVAYIIIVFITAVVSSSS